MVNLLLSKFNPIELISISSINIFPLWGSKSLNTHKHRVLFPLPVLPTTPIFSLGLIIKLRFFNIIGVSSLYFTE